MEEEEAKELTLCISAIKAKTRPSCLPPARGLCGGDGGDGEDGDGDSDDNDGSTDGDMVSW